MKMHLFSLFICVLLKINIQTIKLVTYLCQGLPVLHCKGAYLKYAYCVYS